MASSSAVDDLLVNRQRPASREMPPLKAVRDYVYSEEIQRLRAENEQLRRELKKANERIQDLEDSQRLSLACIIPDTSSDDSDNFSVEVQSVSSSVTTVQAGNMRQQRDDLDREALYVDTTIYRSLTPLASGGRRRREPPSPLSPSFSAMQDIRFLSSSDSNSCTSATSSQSVCSFASSDEGMPENSKAQNRNKVSTYAMKYLLRTNSSESSESDHGASFHRMMEV